MWINRAAPIGAEVAALQQAIAFAEKHEADASLVASGRQVLRAAIEAEVGRTAERRDEARQALARGGDVSGGGSRPHGRTGEGDQPGVAASR